LPIGQYSGILLEKQIGCKLGTIKSNWILDQNKLPLPCSTFLVNQANLNPLQDKHMQCCKYSPSFALLNIPSHPCSLPCSTANASSLSDENIHVLLKPEY